MRAVRIVVDEQGVARATGPGPSSDLGAEGAALGRMHHGSSRFGEEAAAELMRAVVAARAEGLLEVLTKVLVKQSLAARCDMLVGGIARCARNAGSRAHLVLEGCAASCLRTGPLILCGV